VIEINFFHFLSDCFGLLKPFEFRQVRVRLGFHNKRLFIRINIHVNVPVVAFPYRRIRIAVIVRESDVLDGSLLFGGGTEDFAQLVVGNVKSLSASVDVRIEASYLSAFNEGSPNHDFLNVMVNTPGTPAMKNGALPTLTPLGESASFNSSTFRRSTHSFHVIPIEDRKRNTSRARAVRRTISSKSRRSARKIK